VDDRASARLSALDDRFYDVPEDLALLTSQCVGLRPASTGG
jgi:hypothetical protein